VQLRQSRAGHEGDGEAAFGGRGKMEKGRGRSVAGASAEDFCGVRVEQVDDGCDRAAVEAQSGMRVVNANRPLPFGIGDTGYR
jgi:hypothetical protein